MVTFIDDYTRKVWVYLVKRKDQVFDVSDGGGELVNKKFSELFRVTVIRQQKTTAGCPESNGVAERMNQTLISKARCILLESGLDMKLWGEAVNAAAYVTN